MEILNRIVALDSSGINVDANPRHVEILARSLGLETAGRISSPGTKRTVEDFKGEEPDEPNILDEPNALDEDQPPSHAAAISAQRNTATYGHKTQSWIPGATPSSSQTPCSRSRTKTYTVDDREYKSQQRRCVDNSIVVHYIGAPYRNIFGHNPDSVFLSGPLGLRTLGIKHWDFDKFTSQPRHEQHERIRERHTSDKETQERESTIRRTRADGAAWGTSTGACRSKFVFTVKGNIQQTRLGAKAVKCKELLRNTAPSWTRLDLQPSVR